MNEEAGFILKLFESAYMQRWNDKLRPMEFYELDKQAHKMMIAYFITSFEDDPCAEYIKVLKGGLFEFLQRIVITDIKPPVFHLIQRDTAKYAMLNRYILDEIGELLALFGKDTGREFLEYFSSDKDAKHKRILAAAHTYSSIWEFTTIKRLNPDSHDNETIEHDLSEARNLHLDLKGVRELESSESYRKFIQICADLRYQSRWSHLHRIPKTSVLGHSLFVAWLAYYFSTQRGHCERRIYNNFVGGLFHDLPETLTRDIISPVKRNVEGLMELIKDYEDEQMQKVIYPLLPKQVASELRTIMKYEFTNRISVNGVMSAITGEDILEEYNTDENSPYDGEMIKACDDIAAFIEAASAIKNGCVSREFRKAMKYITEKYGKRGPINGIDFSRLAEGLDKAI